MNKSLLSKPSSDLKKKKVITTEDLLKFGLSEDEQDKPKNRLRKA